MPSDTSASIESIPLGGAPGTFNGSVLPFVANVARTIVGDGVGSRVSLATFSSSATLRFGFDEHTSAADVRAAVLATPYAGGATLTSIGLELIENSMVTPANGITPPNSNNGHVVVPRVLVVFTDGPATLAYAPADAALSLRDNAQTEIIAFGMGSNPDLQQLQSMASEPRASNVITVESFGALGDHVNALATAICNVATQTNAPSPNPTSSPTSRPTPSPTPSPSPSPTESPTSSEPTKPPTSSEPTKSPNPTPTTSPSLIPLCSSTLDLMFLVDASLSVNTAFLGGAPNTYQDEVLPFVASLVGEIDVGGTGLADGSFRVSLASFSSTTAEHITFGTHTDIVALRSDIEASPYSGGATFTSLGVALINNTVLPQARVLSEEVPRVLIVITDGQSTSGYDPAAAAADVRAQRTRILAIGFNAAPLSELEAMASTPTGDNVFQRDDFAQLVSEVSAIGAQACELATSFTSAPVASPSDPHPTAAPTCGVNIKSDEECSTLIGGNPEQCLDAENAFLCGGFTRPALCYTWSARFLHAPHPNLLQTRCVLTSDLISLSDAANPPRTCWTLVMTRSGTLRTQTAIDC